MQTSIDLKKLARLPWTEGALNLSSSKKQIDSYLAIKGGWTFWSTKTVSKRPLWLDDEVEYEFSAAKDGLKIIDETGEIAANVFKIVKAKRELEQERQAKEAVQELERLLV